MKKKYVFLSVVVLAVVLLIGGTIWMNRAAESLPEASSILMLNGLNIEENQYGYSDSVNYVFEIPDEETERIAKFSELVSSLELSYCPAHYFSFLEPDMTTSPSWNICYLTDKGDMVTIFFDNGTSDIYVLTNPEMETGLFKVANMEKWRDAFYDFLREAEEFAEKRW